MTHTNFVNPTGLPDPAHTSSARDMAILARAIIPDGSEFYPIYAGHAFKYNGMRLISVVLNTHSQQARANPTRTLLGWGFGSSEKIIPIQPGAVVGSAKVSFGKADTVATGPATPWMLTVPRRGQVQTLVELKRAVQAPLNKGAVIGKVVATSKGKNSGRSPSGCTS